MELNFTPAFWALCGLGAAAALAYGLFFLDKPPGWPRALLKTLFMAALAGASYEAGAHPLLVLALYASAGGDFLLAFDKKWILPLGILSFLAAQLLYIVIFLGLALGGGDGSFALARYAAMGSVGLTSLGFLIVAAPKLGWMALGVIPYALAISAMACVAMWLPWAGLAGDARRGVIPGQRSRVGGGIVSAFRKRPGAAHHQAAGVVDLRGRAGADRVGHRAGVSGSPIPGLRVAQVRDP